MRQNRISIHLDQIWCSNNTCWKVSRIKYNTISVTGEFDEIDTVTLTRFTRGADNCKEEIRNVTPHSLLTWWSPAEDSDIDPITGESCPFFVRTNKRIVHFSNLSAAQLFMKTHCSPWKLDGSVEYVIQTNSFITYPR